MLLLLRVVGVCCVLVVLRLCGLIVDLTGLLVVMVVGSYVCCAV